MKPFSTYQFLEGTEMTERDKLELTSKFWNKGKWDNFVAPLLPKNPKGMGFVDMGCNAGLFLKLAEDYGFSRVIGVDSDETAVKRGLEWREKNKGKYEFHLCKMENSDLPVVDYTVFSNAHYYFTVNDFLDHLDKLIHRTCYVMIITTEKRHLNRCWASADLADIRSYFKVWNEAGFIDELPTTGDPSPRRLWTLMFKSPYVESVPIDSLDSSNHVQDSFYEEIDKGVPYKETRYYRILKPYRKHWSEERLNTWTEERIKVFKDVKEYGLKTPIIIDKNNRILDGNHRYSLMKYLGFKNIYVRIV